MNAWMIGVGYAGSFACCSLWAREWARRKGLNTMVWGVAGAAAGPIGVTAVGLWRARASLCPHCLTPIPFEARYCPTCRSREHGVAEAPSVAPRRLSLSIPLPRRVRARRAARQALARQGGAPLFPAHGYFEASAESPVVTN